MSIYGCVFVLRVEVLYDVTLRRIDIFYESKDMLYAFKMYIRLL